MNWYIAAADVLVSIACPALAEDAAPAPLDHDKVMGQEVFSSDGRSIGTVVDALVAPDGQVVAVAVIDPNAPRIGLALPAELLVLINGKLTANISTEEIAALPEPESESDSDQIDRTPEPDMLPDTDKSIDQ
mgnify:FL=1